MELGFKKFLRDRGIFDDVINQMIDEKFPNNLAAKEAAVVNYLKGFLRQSEDEVHNLETFLRFCTGADILAIDSIQIMFNKSAGLARTPVAHTCGCVLELPTTYANYQDFRSEFKHILGSKLMEMDIA